VRVHRACICTALINEILTGPRPECSLGCCRGIPSGDLGMRSALAGSAHGLGRCNPEPFGAGTRLRCVGCPVVQITAICCRRLDGWRTVRPTEAADSSERLSRRRRCRRMGATLLEPVEGRAGDAPYSGGSPGFFSGGSYGNGAAQDGLERNPRLPFP